MSIHVNINTFKFSYGNASDYVTVYFAYILLKIEYVVDRGIEPFFDNVHEDL